ncbi:MAG: nucleotidyltransferase domain-containing protein [Desulfobacteraceae bacterium]|nr:nucleotidyltransferase domain-containing protein [Desulfobacteraceae bacterium]
MGSKELTDEINNIVQQIIQRYNPLKIILFGSAAQKGYHQVNDLDFVIIKENIPINGVERIRELDKLIERNIATDMLVYRPDEFEQRINMGDPFVKSVIKDGQVLYG